MKRILLITLGLSVALLADFSRDDSTQIVTDNTTGLEWQDDADAKNISKNWKDAIAHCEALELGGYSNWRLPNFNELYYIADRSKVNPAMSSTFENFSTSYYWTATTYANYTQYAWVVYFYYGYDSSNYKSNSYRVRCVRARQ